MLSWTFFRRYLFSEKAGSLVKRIAWLCIFGIGFSLASFILILSIMTGLNKNIHNRILAVEPHLSVEFKKNITEGEVLVHPVWRFLKGQREMTYRLFDTQDVILRTVDGIFHGATARGMASESFDGMFSQLQKLARESHSSPPENLGAPDQDEVILGVDLAKAMGVFEGDYLTVLPLESLILSNSESPSFAKVLVKQILATNLADIDSQVMFFQREKTMQHFAKVGSRRVGIEVWSDDAYDLNSAKLALQHFKDLKVETWKDRNSALFMALRLEKLVIGTFLGLSALITSFSILSVLTLLISQKRREMGLLMAIGFSVKSLSRLFQQLGMILSILGLVVGVVVGTAMALYVEEHPLHVLPDIYYDSEVPAEVQGVFIVSVFIIGFIMAWSAVRLSVKQIAHLTPSDALRIK
jgi:lipoprotein-releasing system permease protein